MLYDLVKSVALFPGNLIVVLLLAALLTVRRSRVAFLVLLTSAAALYAFSTPVLGYGFLASLHAGIAPLEDEDADGAGAIIVLSAGVSGHAPEYGGPVPGPLTLYRIRYAAHLHKRLGLPILVAGGEIRGVIVADTMADVLREDYGIVAKWRETQSANTRENAINTARILEAENIDKILLVTHAWHMARAREVFERQGLLVVAAGTGFVGTGDRHLRDFFPKIGALNASFYASHEYLGRLWYILHDAYQNTDLGGA